MPKNVSHYELPGPQFIALEQVRVARVIIDDEFINL